MSEWPFGDLPMFGYEFIMADPPWRFEAWSTAGRNHKSPDHHYDTLTCDQIKEMFPVGHLASKDCLLWLWGTHPMVDQQIEVGRHWGFKFVTSGVWVKRTKSGKLAFGTGYRLRSASEPFLIFTNGEPDTCPVVRSVIEGVRREHSRKPEEAYVEAERLLPTDNRKMVHGRCLDLFSRTDRDGWDSWGDEVGKFGRAA